MYFTSVLFHVPSGRVGIALPKFCIWTDPLTDAILNPDIDFSLSFFIRIKYTFFSWFENQYLCCHFKVSFTHVIDNNYAIHIEYILKPGWDLRWIMV